MQNNLGFKAFVGGIAGLLAWLVTEPLAPNYADQVKWAGWERIFIALIGVFVGAAVGGLSGWFQGGKTHTTRGIVLGALFGMIGIQFGDGLGSPIFHALTGGQLTGSLLTMPARAIALTLVGAGLGVGIGASSLNGKKAFQGLLGGAAGGALGGLLFDPLASILGQVILTANHTAAGKATEIGGPSRAAYALLLGASIALFIGLVERIARSAWLRLELGRNEGREWALDFPTNIVGRSESANIPLFGDPSIAPQHCAIQKQGDQYWLTDLGSQMGTGLNGQRIAPNAPAPLMHGSIIGVGSNQLVFLMKNQAAPARPVDGGYYGAPMNVPQVPVPAAATAGWSSGPAMQPTVAMPAQTPLQPTIMAAPAGMSLVALDGPLKGQRFSVFAPLEVGRESPAIPLAYDNGISRRHASLSPVLGGLNITDLGSSNGTFVDGQRIQTAMLTPGRTVRFGGTTFRLEG